MAVERGPDDLERVTAAYGAWAGGYVDAFGDAEKADEEDRTLVGGWARGLTGRVLDAGCGPGHWSAFLHGRGLAVEGVDATPAFVAHARRAHPGIGFEVADLRALALPDRSLGGVLAWFSLIHMAPGDARDLLQGFARALRPGGGLLVGFFAGDRVERFDHRVVTGWTWPVPSMVEAVGAAGLAVTAAAERPGPSGRRLAALSARRPD